MKKQINESEVRMPKFFTKNYAKLLKDAILSRIQRNDSFDDAQKSYIETMIESEYTEIQKLQLDDIDKEYDKLKSELE